MTDVNNELLNLLSILCSSSIEDVIKAVIRQYIEQEHIIEFTIINSRQNKIRFKH